MDKQKPGANQTALITGASSGIGEELAACFARDGFNLVLVARSADQLKTLATHLAAEHGIKAWVAPIDLAKSGNAALLAAKMNKDKHAIDVLVNCAGVLEHGQFVQMQPGRHQELIDLNVSALTEMLAHFAAEPVIPWLAPVVQAVAHLDTGDAQAQHHQTDAIDAKRGAPTMAPAAANKATRRTDEGFNR